MSGNAGDERDGINSNRDGSPSTADNSTDDASSSSAVAMMILLPNSDHHVVAWKVSSGSAVRQGETVAVVAPSVAVEAAASAGVKAPQHPQQADTITADKKLAVAASAPPPTRATAHKRPKKRRRMVPSASSPAATTTDAKQKTYPPQPPPPVGVAGAAGAATPTTSVTTKTDTAIEKEKSTPATLMSRIRSTSTSSTASVASSTLPSAASTCTLAAATVALTSPRDGIFQIQSSPNNPLQVAVVQECDHPTVVLGMCVVCGMAIAQKPKQPPQQQEEEAMRSDVMIPHNERKDQGSNNLAVKAAAAANSSSLLTVSGGLTVSISAREQERMAAQDRQRLHKQRKLSLVLDLDHTVVHATHDVRAAHIFRDQREQQQHGEEGQTDNSNQTRTSEVRTLVLPVATVDGGWRWQQHWVKVRPHVVEFLKQVSQLYELSVYTAGTRDYAEQVCNLLARQCVGCGFFTVTGNNDAVVDGTGGQSSAGATKRRTVLDAPELQQLQHQVQQAQERRHRREQREKQQLKEQPEQQDSKPTQAAATTSTASAEDSSKMEQEEQSKQEDAAPKTTAKDKDGDVVMSNGSSESKQAERDGDKSSNDKEAESQNPSKKRKKVSFGELPPEPQKRSPPAAESEPPLEQLEQQLKEAQQWEQQAMDLRRHLFGRRIISRTDTAGDLDPNVKSLKRMFPCGGSMAVVVDDREDVWAAATDNENSDDDDKANGASASNGDSNNNNNAQDDPTRQWPGEPPHNLLLVKPYHWGPFAGFANVNNASGPDLSQSPQQQQQQLATDEADSSAKKQERDEQLNWTADVLKRIHETYYSDETNPPMPGESHRRQRTVPQLIRQMRRRVLGGGTNDGTDNDNEDSTQAGEQVHMLLSGLVPLRRQQQQQDCGRRRRPRPPFVRYAQSLGALLSQQVPTTPPQLTHVVAAKDGTEKVLQARKQAALASSWQKQQQDAPQAQSGNSCASVLKVVKPSWLMECVWTLTRRDETPHVWIGKAINYESISASEGVAAADSVSAAKEQESPRTDKGQAGPQNDKAKTATDTDAGTALATPLSEEREKPSIQSSEEQGGTAETSALPYDELAAALDQDLDDDDDDDDDE